MRKHLALATFSASVALSGCVPMENAPLVYASKASLGVNVAVGQPEQPGLAVVLGYGGVDAAYVPVFVAKPCPSGQICNEKNYLPVEIGGSSVETAETRALEARIAQLDSQIAAARKLRATEEVNANATEKELRDLPVKEKRRAEIEATIAATEATNTDDPSIPGLKTELAAQATRPKTTIEKENAAANENIRALNVEIPRLELEREREAAALAGLGNANRKDSYSVYGSFNGSTSGNRDGATLGAGKVFSTGVAAQNLTSGIARAAVYTEQARHYTEQARFYTEQARCLSVVKAGEAGLIDDEVVEYRKTHRSTCGAGGPP